MDSFTKLDHDTPKMTSILNTVCCQGLDKDYREDGESLTAPLRVPLTSSSISSSASSEDTSKREKSDQTNTHLPESRGKYEHAQLQSRKQEQQEDSEAQQLATSQENIPDGGMWAWLQVLCAWCIWFNTWGLVSSFGMYETIYMEQNLANRETISWIGSVQGSIVLFVSVVAGWLFDLGYLRRLVLTGHILLVGGMIATSFCSEFWSILATQGIMVGLGASLLFTPAVNTLAQWFKRRKGLAVGLASTGNAFGGVIFPLLFRALLPPLGLPWTTRILAFTIVALSLPPLLFMRQRSPHNPHLQRPNPGRPPRDKVFILLCASIFLINAGVYVPFFYLPSYALGATSPLAKLSAKDLSSSPSIHGSPTPGYPTPSPDTFPIYLIAFANAASLSGRILPGFLGDRLGLLNMQLLSALLCTITAFSWLATPPSPTPLILFATFYGATSGAVLALAWTLVGALAPRGKKDMGVRLGWFGMAAGMGMLLGAPVAGRILGSEGGWMGLKVWCGGCLVAATGCLGVVRFLKEEGQEESGGNGSHQP